MHHQSYLMNVLDWVRTASNKFIKFTTESIPFIQKLKKPQAQKWRNPGLELRIYVAELGTDKRSQFHKNIASFISCTKTSSERDSTVILTNIRQFSTGMKNYLLENGGKRFNRLVDEAKRSDEHMTFDLDAILESVLFDLIVEPLYDLLLEALSNDCYSNVVDIIENSKDIGQLSLPDLGLQLKPYSDDVIHVVRHYLRKMQMGRSPLDKLDYFLAAITIVLKTAVSCETGEPAVVYSDELVPLIVWMLASCGVMTVEMELLFIQRLIHPAFTRGECNYYLNALTQAVQVLKQPERLFHNYQFKPKHVWRTGRRGVEHEVLRVLVPDPHTGVPFTAKIIRHRPDVTASQVCNTMSRKLRMPNPELCSLFKLVDGQASLLGDDARLMEILKEENESGRLCYFVYMYAADQIRWPLDTAPS